MYEFRTGFVYLLYVILLTIGVGYFTQQNAISYTGIGLMVLHVAPRHGHHTAPEFVYENQPIR